jgi:hypothetical protein
MKNSILRIYQHRAIEIAYLMALCAVAYIVFRLAFNINN